MEKTSKGHSSLVNIWSKEGINRPVNHNPNLSEPSTSKGLTTYMDDDVFNLDDEADDEMLLRALEMSMQDEKASEHAKLSKKADCGTPLEYIPGFDVSAGSTWIYPTNYPIREYQFNITREALFKNTMVILPTGLGKTYIAAIVMYNFYRWYPQGKVIFMAPTRPLVAQQIEACHKIMGIPTADSIEMTGTMSPENRSIAWKKQRVLFLTPQVMTNDLTRGYCPAESVKCIVVDEAHKAQGNHAYCQVVKQLLNHSTHFRVLALSATPGKDVQSVMRVLENLLISHVELRTEESLDIRPYTHDRLIEKIVVPLGDELSTLKSKFLEIIKYYLNRLCSKRVIASTNPEQYSKFRILKMKEQLTENLSSFRLSKSEHQLVVCDLCLCISLYHALELLQLHGMRPFYIFLKATVDGNKGNPRSRCELLRNANFEEVMFHLEEKFGGVENVGNSTSFLNTSNGARQSGAKEFEAGHPKIKKLEEIVVQHFQKFQQEAGHVGGSSVNTRVMIFSQYRDSVQEISEVLKKHRPLVRVMSFIGQATATKTTKGFSQKKQQQVIREFRQGGYNTLVATCVAEEGLDIGEVDLILCYDAPKSPIRLIQRMGRTGRKRSGRIVVLVTEGKEEQMYKQSVNSKKNIHKAIVQGNKFMNLYPNNPRMVPRGINPSCLQMRMAVEKYTAPGKRGVASNERTITSMLAVGKKSKGSALLSLSELEYWNEKFKLPEDQVPVLQALSFVTLPSNRKVQEEKWSKRPLLSLSDWTPWQDMPQPVYRIGHSSRTTHLVEIMQFIQQQEFLSPDQEDDYDLQMAPFLKMDDVLPLNSHPTAQRTIESRVTEPDDARLDEEDRDTVNIGASKQALGLHRNAIPGKKKKFLVKHSKSRTIKNNFLKSKTKRKPMMRKKLVAEESFSLNDNAIDLNSTISVVSCEERGVANEEDGEELVPPSSLSQRRGQEVLSNDVIEGANNTTNYVTYLGIDIPKKCLDAMVPIQIKVPPPDSELFPLEKEALSPVDICNIFNNTTQESKSKMVESCDEEFHDFGLASCARNPTEHFPDRTNRDCSSISGGVKGISVTNRESNVPVVDNIFNTPLECPQLMSAPHKSAMTARIRQNESVECLADQVNPLILQEIDELSMLMTIPKTNQDNLEGKSAPNPVVFSLNIDLEKFRCSTPKSSTKRLLVDERDLVAGSDLSKMCDWDLADEDFDNAIGSSPEPKSVISIATDAAGSCEQVNARNQSEALSKSGHCNPERCCTRMSTVLFETTHHSPLVVSKMQIECDQSNISPSPPEAAVTAPPREKLNRLSKSKRGLISRNGSSSFSPKKSTSNFNCFDDLLKENSSSLEENSATAGPTDVCGETKERKEHNRNILSSPPIAGLMPSPKALGKFSQLSKSKEELTVSKNRSPVESFSPERNPLPFCSFNNLFRKSTSSLKGNLVIAGCTVASGDAVNQMQCNQNNISLSPPNGDLSTPPRGPLGKLNRLSKSKRVLFSKNRSPSFSPEKNTSLFDSFDDIFRENSSNLEDNLGIVGGGDTTNDSSRYTVTQLVNMIDQQKAGTSSAQTTFPCHDKTSPVLLRTFPRESNASFTVTSQAEQTAGDRDLSSSKVDEANVNFDLGFDLDDESDDAIPPSPQASLMSQRSRVVLTKEQETTPVKNGPALTSDFGENDVQKSVTTSFMRAFPKLANASAVEMTQPALKNSPLSLKSNRKPVDSSDKARPADKPAISTPASVMVALVKPQVRQMQESATGLAPVQPGRAAEDLVTLGRRSDRTTGDNITPQVEREDIVTLSMDQIRKHSHDDEEDFTFRRKRPKLLREEICSEQPGGLPVAEAKSKSVPNCHRKFKESVAAVAGKMYLKPEADVSVGDMNVSSDEDDSDGMDQLDSSFIDDEEEEEPSTQSSSVTEAAAGDMKAVYLRSVAGVVNHRNGFKLKYDYNKDLPVCSQSPVSENDDYELDSFCVANDHKDSPVLNSHCKQKVSKWRRIIKLDSSSEGEPEGTSLNDTLSSEGSALNPIDCDQISDVKGEEELAAKHLIHEKTFSNTTSERPSFISPPGSVFKIPSAHASSLAANSVTVPNLLPLNSQISSAFTSRTLLDLKRRQQEKREEFQRKFRKLLSVSSPHHHGKLTILIDSKEISSSQVVVSYLRTKHNVEAVVQSLTAADYIVSNRMGVCRKLIKDAGQPQNQQNLIDRVRQLCELFDRPLLILEYDKGKQGEARSVHRSKYLDMVLSYLSHTCVRVLYSESQELSAELLADLARQEDRKSHPIQVPLPFIAQHRFQSAVISFYLSLPQVSTICALNLAHGFKSIQDFVVSSPERIENIGKVSRTRALAIYKYVRHQYFS